MEIEDLNLVGKWKGLSEHKYSYYKLPLVEKFMSFLPLKNGLFKWIDGESKGLVKANIIKFISMKEVDEDSKNKYAKQVLSNLDIVAKNRIRFKAVERYFTILLVLVIILLLILTPSYTLKSFEDVQLNFSLISLVYYIVGIIITFILILLPSNILYHLLIPSNTEEGIILPISIVIIVPMVIIIQLLHSFGYQNFIPDYFILFKIAIDDAFKNVGLYSAIIFSIYTYVLLLLFAIIMFIVENAEISYLRKNKPRSFIIEKLISAIYEIKNIGSSELSIEWISYKSKIEAASSCIENNLYKESSGNQSVDIKIQGRFKKIAQWLRERNYILNFEESNSSEQVSKELSEFLINFISYEYGKLPKNPSIAFINPSRRKTYFEAFKYLLTFILLIFLVAVIDLIPMEKFEQFTVIVTTFKTTLYVGIIIIFISIIELILGKELPSISKFIDYVGKPGSKKDESKKDESKE